LGAVPGDPVPFIGILARRATDNTGCDLDRPATADCDHAHHSSPTVLRNSARVGKLDSIRSSCRIITPSHRSPAGGSGAASVCELLTCLVHLAHAGSSHPAGAPRRRQPEFPLSIYIPPQHRALPAWSDVIPFAPPPYPLARTTTRTVVLSEVRWNAFQRWLWLIQMMSVGGEIGQAFWARPQPLLRTQPIGA